MDTKPHHEKLVTVLLADDYPVTRAGIRAILKEEPKILVVGEAESGFEVKKMVAELHPKVLLLDLQMPGPTPADLERWVRQNFPEIVTLVLTAHARDAYLATMMDAGVSGFLSKKEAGRNLITAILRAINGEYLFSQEQQDRANYWRLEAGQKWASLSKREKEVLQHLASGKNSSAIATDMKVTLKTIAFHIGKILDKLDAKSRGEAVAWVQKYAPVIFEENQ